MQRGYTSRITNVGFSLGPPLNTEERRPFLPTTHNSGTSEETPSQEIMSNAFKCPLVHQLNSLQIQPLHPYASHDTFVHPNDRIDICDKTFFLLKDDIEPHIKNYDETSGDAYTPPLALWHINIHSITRHKVPNPPKLHHNLITAI